MAKRRKRRKSSDDERRMICAQTVVSGVSVAQVARRYGSTSEQTKQLVLALEVSEVAEAAMTAKMKLPPDQPKDKPKRRPIPDHIPRNNIELLPPKDHCTCGGALRQIGEDVTEELEYVPGRFVVNKITRPRIACKRCERFTQAVLPSRPIKHARAGHRKNEDRAALGLCPR